MSQSPEKDPLLVARNRDRRLRELDHEIHALRADMYSLVADINAHLEKAGVRGQQQVAKSGAAVTVRARVHRGAPTTISYGLYDRQLHRFKTRSRIVDANMAGANWMMELEGKQRKEIIQLDRRRRILNHQYCIAFAERKSLLRFDQEERGIEAALESDRQDQPKQE